MPRASLTLLRCLLHVQGVVAVMQASQGDTKDDAAGVLRNCSNYSSEATEVGRAHSKMVARGPP